VGIIGSLGYILEIKSGEVVVHDEEGGAIEEVHVEERLLVFVEGARVWQGQVGCLAFGLVAVLSELLDSVLDFA